jgi:hypothetical protein
MTDFIEVDAIANTPENETPPIRDHPHAVKSFIATPRMDKTLIQKFKGMFRDDHVLGVKTFPADNTGLRHIFSITSNAYMDRENETITSKALEEYVASCFPAEDVYHNDNPYLWWHDDDVVMGKIISTSYIKPFLIEIIEEIPNDPISKVLFDFAEENGDNAGASHRFGYREEDRTADGDYLHIFKQESTYLPDRALAANAMTYAGVITSMSAQSDKHLDQVFAKITSGAATEVAAKLHGTAAERAKLLSELNGLVYKAKPAALMDEAEGLEADAVDEMDGEKKEAPADMGKWVSTLNSIYSLVMELVGSQQGSMEAEMALVKSVKALEDERTKAKAYEQTLEQRVAMLEAREKLTPRSAQQQKGTNYEAIAEVVKAAEIAKEEGETTIDPFWGKMKKLPTQGENR